MSRIFSFPFGSSVKKQVAHEAAILLYTSQEKEYRHAKERAANILGVTVLPSNFEVAEELDLIAEEREGSNRRERLIRMRNEALEIMKDLEVFLPKLVGSVWRGTAHLNSDIDIIVFAADRKKIVAKLKEKDYNIVSAEPVTTTRNAEKISSLHLTVILPSHDKAEIVVRTVEDAKREEICSIYGDAKNGLDLTQLRKILKENPVQRFVPKKKRFGL